MMTWNEFDLAVLEVVAELSGCGDFSSVKYELPRSRDLSGPLETTVQLTCAVSGHLYRLPVIEHRDDLERGEPYISLTVPLTETEEGLGLGQNPPRLLYFQFENVYRALFFLADGARGKT